MEKSTEDRDFRRFLYRKLTKTLQFALLRGTPGKGSLESGRAGGTGTDHFGLRHVADGQLERPKIGISSKL